MKVPQYGVFVNPDGSVVWAWSLSEPHADLEHLPPLTRKADGSFVTTTDPGGYLLDLENIIDPEDMPYVYRDLTKIKVRDEQGTPTLKETLIDQQGNSLGEIEHPAIARKKIIKCMR